jgi:hypothetical protein
MNGIQRKNIVNSVTPAGRNAAGRPLQRALDLF